MHCAVLKLIQLQSRQIYRRIFNSLPIPTHITLKLISIALQTYPPCQVMGETVFIGKRSLQPQVPKDPSQVKTRILSHPVLIH